MPLLKHRLAALVFCIAPALAHGALFEIHEPVGNAQAIRPVAQLRLPEAWQSTTIAHARWILPGDGDAAFSPAAQVLRVANPAGIAGLADRDLVIDARQGSRGIGGAAAASDAERIPEFWTLVVLGAGLVAYQLRRQSRSRSGMIRFPQ